MKFDLAIVGSNFRNDQKISLIGKGTTSTFTRSQPSDDLFLIMIQ